MEIQGDLCHDLLSKKMIQKLAFNENEDFEVQRKKIKEKYIELLGIDSIKNNACDLNVQIESIEEKDGYTLTSFVFESEVGSFVPCYLLVPNTGKKKYPLAITMQGHSTGYHNSIGVVKYEEDKSYMPRGAFALQAVKNGFATLAIEQRGMGIRRPSGKHQKMASMCEYEAHIALLLGRTIIGERVWDISRAIDAMSNFSQVDTDKILITGNSGGGTISFYAAAYDERIKLSVPSCAFCAYKESIMYYYHCSCNFIPHVYEYFDMGDLATLIAPRDFIVIAGSIDPIFPIDGVHKAYSTVEKIYKKIGALDKCSIIETPKAHWWCEDIVWQNILDRVKKLGW